MISSRVMGLVCCFLFFKQKTAYEMRISDWSSDVCSSDLARGPAPRALAVIDRGQRDRDRAADVGLVEFLARQPIDEAGRQVERRVHHARDPEPVERLGEPRPHALERGDLCEQWIEDFGPHDYHHALP